MAEGSRRFVLFWDFKTGSTRYGWRLRGESGETLAFSKESYTNKPFCDNTHKEIGFRHEGSLGENRLASGEAANGRALRIIPIANGPYLLRGEVEIRDAAGQTAYRGSKASLCRCGRSENKPFCDGSHARTGWREDR